MKTKLVLSPHLDDAVLSVGGSMAEAAGNGKCVIVFNLFCAPYHGSLSPAAQSLHASWGNPIDITGLRLEEDHRALALIGAEQVIGDVRDLIYRQSALGEWLYANMEDIQGERNIEDNPLVEKYVAKISDLFPQNEFDVSAPLGIGGHIDHMLAYDIGVQLRQAGYGVKFYEDLPYALREDWLNDRLNKLENMTPEIEFFSLQNLKKKIEALGFYHSQIPSLFENEENMRDWLTRQAFKMSGREDKGGEKVWEFASN
jgi:LmbE family N-acetylglucosaminyl deacetylase